MSRRAREEHIVKRVMTFVVTALIAAVPLSAFAQGPFDDTAGSAQVAAPQVPLKIQLVVTRTAGDKKVSSTPYTLSVVANDNDKTSLRMGVDVAVPQSVIKQGGGVSEPITSYNYRSIGTNIDCTAKTIGEGLYKLDLGVSDSSLMFPEKGATAVPGTPAFRSFTSTFNVVLKDGQTTQHTSATDPVSGEVLRVDVTLTVLK